MTQKDPLFGYIFNDSTLQALALTHPSCCLEQGDNQRLEFLGDAVLDLVVAERLYAKLPHADEGVLDRARASLVNGATLAATARSIGLEQHILVSESQRQHHPEPSNAMLEDCFEALIGAIYLDGGLAAAEEFIGRALDDRIARISGSEDPRNPKSRLQEWSQSAFDGAIPNYRLMQTSGPDHQRRYQASVSLNGQEISRGEGSSIKAAESAAAAAALRSIEAND